MSKTIYTFDRPERLAAVCPRLERIPHRRRARRSRPERLRGGYVQHWAVAQALDKGIPPLAILQDTDNKSAKFVTGQIPLAILISDGDAWEGHADSNGPGQTERVTSSYDTATGYWRLNSPNASNLFSFGDTFDVGDQLQMYFEKPNGDVFINTYPYEVLAKQEGTNRLFFDKPMPNPADFSQVATDTDPSPVLEAGTLVTVVRIDNV